MSVAEYNRIVTEWTRTHWDSERPCPLCGKVAGWGILPPVEMPVRNKDVEGQPPGMGLPMVPLICKNCAYVACLAALVVGAIAPDPPAGGTGATA
jgi:hypothetical protein